MTEEAVLMPLGLTEVLQEAGRLELRDVRRLVSRIWHEQEHIEG